MIRCDGFGKFLKQGLFTLSISCFILLGGSFVSSAKVQMIGLDGEPSIYNNQYNLSFLKGGGLLTNYLGTSKGILALSNDVIFWRASNGLPYFYSPRFQGFFNTYYSCDEFSLDSPTLSNCSPLSIDSGSIEIFQGFFKNVLAGDFVYYNYDNVHEGVHCSIVKEQVQVCYSSSSLHSSLCFAYKGDCYYGCQGGAGYCNGLFGGGFRDSQNYSNLTFSNIPYSSIGYAPGQAGYGGGGNIDGGSTDVNNSQITGDVMYSTCTKNRALNWYKRNGYTEKICYSSYHNNSDLFNGAGSVNAFALTGTDIKDVWGDTSEYLRNGNTGGSMGYSQWLHYWRNTYEVYQRNSDTYSNPFIGVPVSIFTLMGNIDVYGKPFTNESIIDYCNLLLYTSDLNSAYSGVYSSQICSQSALDILADTVGVHASGGKVVEGSSRDGVTNRPGKHNPPVGNGGSQNGSVSGSGSDGNDLETFQDGLTFQNNSFNLLKGTFKFPQNTGSNGVLPSYIIITLLALVFFRFISH